MPRGGHGRLSVEAHRTGPSGSRCSINGSPRPEHQERAGAAESETPTPDKEIGELALFDPNALTRLVGSKPATHDRLLRHFPLASLEERRMALLQARDRQDLVAIGQFAHSLKSAARRRCDAARELCDRLERAGGAGMRRPQKHCSRSSETNCQAVVQAVDAWVGGAPVRRATTWPSKVRNRCAATFAVSGIAWRPAHGQ